MANIRKSFNLRNGVQVDDDNFIVNPNGLVGIGTSTPSEILDVYGNIKSTDTIFSNQIESPNLNISGIGTVEQLIANSYFNIGITSITSGIIDATVGVVTYYGDGGSLLNLPTSQWLDVDVGLGFTSIYAQGNVGVGTIDPRFTFQVGGNTQSPIQNGVGINNLGDIYASGIVTAANFYGSGEFISSINAANITLGTLNTQRLPSNINVSGIITAGTHFSGTLIGVAATANDITSTSSISITGLNVGISTITTLLNSQGPIGIGTNVTNADLHIRRSGITSLRLTSDGNHPSRIIFGRNSSIDDQNAEIRFGNTDSLYTFSDEQSLDIINYDDGNFNYYNNISGGSGNYNWFAGATNQLMSLTSSGNLGINIENPSENLHVVGTSTVTSDSFVGGNFSVDGNVIINGTFFGGGIVISDGNLNLKTAIFENSLAVSTPNIDSQFNFQVGTDPFATNGGIGISSTGNLYSSGVTTSTRFSGNGSTLTNLNASNISSGTLNNARLPSNISITGDISAANLTSSGTISGTYSGNGSALTDLNASNISSGTLNNARLPSSISVTGNITSSSGNISGVNGTFSGNISGENLTLGGNATVSGNLSAANGTFTGNLVGNSLSTGNGNITIVISGNQLTFIDTATNNSVTLTLT
jgi:cytoskeletal protein CcmA (bactofilin family)